jgi:hypothetical protein
LTYFIHLWPFNSHNNDIQHLKKDLQPLQTSRVGAVAHYIELRVVLRKYRKWPFSAAHRIKTLEPIDTELNVIDYVIESPSVPSMLNIGPVDSPPHMGEVVDYR